MVESKKLYSRKDEKDIFKEIEQESYIPDEEIPIDDEEIEEYLKWLGYCMYY